MLSKFKTIANQYKRERSIAHNIDFKLSLQENVQTNPKKRDYLLNVMKLNII